jgi:hypothetical protein
VPLGRSSAFWNWNNSNRKAKATASSIAGGYGTHRLWGAE